MKENGAVFTPQWIVKKMLEEINYSGNVILNKTICEPSFGEGAFLIEIVKRICDICIKENISKNQVKTILEKNVYGVEIDKRSYDKAIRSLNETAQNYNINDIRWALTCGNAFDYMQNKTFDYIIGNPPYIRVHNLSEDIRQKCNRLSFTEGMNDIYTAFFEFGIKCLAKDGVLCYITPSGYIKNRSQRKMREYFANHNLVKKIIDFGQERVFDGIGTYTCITIINNKKQNNEIVYERANTISTKYVSHIKLDEADADGWIIGTQDDIDFIKTIKKRKMKLSDICKVQNGIATNADNVYIGKIQDIDKEICLFNENKIERKALNKVIKGSRAGDEEEYIIFPYQYNGDKYEIIPEEEYKQAYPLAYQYFLNNRGILEKRNMERNSVWYSFARSQCINSTNKIKFTFKNYIGENTKKLKVIKVNPTELIYSGICICVTKENEKKIKSIIESDEFLRWCRLMGKPLQGNTVRISAKIAGDYGVAFAE